MNKNPKDKERVEVLRSMISESWYGISSFPSTKFGDAIQRFHHEFVQIFDEASNAQVIDITFWMRNNDYITATIRSLDRVVRTLRSQKKFTSSNVKEIKALETLIKEIKKMGLLDILPEKQRKGLHDAFKTFELAVKEMRVDISAAERHDTVIQSGEYDDLLFNAFENPEPPKAEVNKENIQPNKLAFRDIPKALQGKNARKLINLFKMFPENENARHAIARLEKYNLRSSMSELSAEDYQYLHQALQNITEPAQMQIALNRLEEAKAYLGKFEKTPPENIGMILNDLLPMLYDEKNCKRIKADLLNSAKPETGWSSYLVGLIGENVNKTFLQLKEDIDMKLHAYNKCVEYLKPLEELAQKAIKISRASEPAFKPIPIPKEKKQSWTTIDTASKKAKAQKSTLTLGRRSNQNTPEARASSSKEEKTPANPEKPRVKVKVKSKPAKTKKSPRKSIREAMTKMKQKKLGGRIQFDDKGREITGDGGKNRSR